MRPAEPDPEQLRAALIAEHGEQQILLNGQSIAFRDYVAVGDMLCPIPADQRSPEDNLRRLTKELIKMDVQLDEKYAPFIPEQPKQETTQQKPAAKIEKAETPDKKIQDKPEPAPKEPVLPHPSTKDMSPVVAAAPEKLEVPEIAVFVPKEVLEQTVKLELPTVEPVEVLEKPAPQQEYVENRALEETIVIDEVQQLVEPLVSPTAHAYEHQEHQEESEPEQEIQYVEIDADTEEGQLAEVVAETVWLESEQIEFGESEVQLPEEVYAVAGDESFFVQIIEETTTETIAIDTEVSASTEFEPVQHIELQASDPGVSFENEVVAPVAVAKEFVAQVLPTLPEAVVQKIESMEPEVATELASRIEMIVIVADRLHELVVTGTAEGEEAMQIQSFLKREYEQVLLAIGIEPTDELLDEFIAFIFADSHQLQVGSVGNYIQIKDEGTHEKKLFDEQSVFAKAQHASTVLSQKLGSSIGHILVTNLAP